MADFMNGDDTKMKQTAQNIEKKIDEAVIMLQVVKLFSVKISLLRSIYFKVPSFSSFQGNSCISE